MLPCERKKKMFNTLLVSLESVKYPLLWKETGLMALHSHYKVFQLYMEGENENM